jgi:endonuclease YncB( thermonuclease family)
MPVPRQSRSQHRRRLCHLAALPLVLVIATSVWGATLVGHAIVGDDASLLIKGQTVHLFGVYIPPTNRQCRAWISPLRCDSRAALDLDFKVSGFITCFPVSENDDGSLNATCYQDRTSFHQGTDLAAYLIERGWALALPDAPFEYQALEKIARNQGVGVWGYTIDSIERGDRPVYPPGRGRR